DEELIGHLRQRLGRHVTLRLDANGGYANPKAAIRAVRAMERHGLDYVEQPVPGKARLAEVTRAVTAGTVADESCWSLADAIELHELRAVDAISIYVGKAGGLYRARAIAAFAAAVGLPHDVNGSLELGIGAAANLHLIAASPNGRLASVTPVNGPAEARASRVAGRYSSDDVIAAPFRFEAGMVVLDERPGLGIEVDEGKLELYTVEHRVSECEGLRVRQTE
ncbi:MAG: mandelate racemase, partial [Chloroflexi bacterium]|nr:mandelate racemase [Chloroflexota bacterium]